MRYTDPLGLVGEDNLIYILSELPDVLAYAAKGTVFFGGSLLVYGLAQVVNFYCDDCINNLGGAIGGDIYEFLNPYTPTPAAEPAPVPAPTATQPSQSCKE